MRAGGLQVLTQIQRWLAGGMIRVDLDKWAHTVPEADYREAAALLEDYLTSDPEDEETAATLAGVVVRLNKLEHAVGALVENDSSDGRDA